jgi:hypothetical protein
MCSGSRAASWKAALDAKQAKEKAEADAKVQQERAEAEAKLQRERAVREAADRENARLQEQAQKAAEWQSKIQEARQKGSDYAKATDLKWSLTEKVNPMTRRERI